MYMYVPMYVPKAVSHIAHSCWNMNLWLVQRNFVQWYNLATFGPKLNSGTCERCAIGQMDVQGLNQGIGSTCNRLAQRWPSKG